MFQTPNLLMLNYQEMCSIHNQYLDNYARFFFMIYALTWSQIQYIMIQCLKKKEDNLIISNGIIRYRSKQIKITEKK